MAKVAIVKQDSYKDVYRGVSKAIDLLGGPESFVKPGDRVVIKPNFWCWGYSPKEAPEVGIMTHPAFVKAIVKLLKGAGAEVTVAESDSTSFDADDVFEKSGMKHAVEQVGGKVMNLRKCDKVELPIEGTEAKSILVPSIIRDADLVISAPKMKAHPMTTVTLGMKNMFGAIPVKYKLRYHSHDLSEFIPDVILAMKPDLTIIDGITGYEQALRKSSSRTLNPKVIVAGTDVVATDAVGASIMGFDPMEIGHIANAARRGLGEAELEKISILGASIEEVRQQFAHLKSPMWYRATDALARTFVRVFGVFFRS